MEDNTPAEDTLESDFTAPQLGKICCANEVYTFLNVRCKYSVSVIGKLILALCSHFAVALYTELNTVEKE